GSRGLRDERIWRGTTRSQRGREGENSRNETKLRVKPSKSCPLPSARSRAPNGSIFPNGRRGPSTWSVRRIREGQLKKRAGPYKNCWRSINGLVSGRRCQCKRSQKVRRARIWHTSLRDLFRLQGFRQ